MPKIDNLVIFRCVQVVRRLLLKNRDIGLFCNLSGVDADRFARSFPQFLEFMDANRAIASSLVLEFTQSALRTMGPIEHESLAALAERGFRFSLDNVTDLRIEPRELADRGFRFIKVPASLLLNRTSAPRPTSTPPISPTCSAASASISSPRGSRARAAWSICSITTCASARASCSRRRGRCARRRCRELAIAPT